MKPDNPDTCVAFQGDERVASGPLADIAPVVKRIVDRDEQAPVLVFDGATSRLVDLDLRGELSEVLARYGQTVGPAEEGSVEPGAQPRRGPGRPRLGVVSREVTLLPRHWAWLASQRGGASATLRRLVEQARKASARSDLVRDSQDAAYRFMLAMAGDRPGYEEAVRALYAGDAAGFEARIQDWPPDIAEHSRNLAEGALGRPVMSPPPRRS